MKLAPRTITSRRRGFSAVEIMAVAAIIAILALLLIPNLSERVEESRKVAVEDELGNMVKFITIAYAETGKYVRLQDYDNGKILNAPAADPAKEAPRWAYDPATGDAAQMADDSAARAALARRWNGAYTHYISEKKYVTVEDMRNDTFWSVMLDEDEGPVFVPPATDTSEDLDRYPLDPWGNPYLFFPPETDWATCLIFSLGPNGLPGDEAAPVHENYFPYERRDTNDYRLGAPSTDDIRWEF